MPPALPSNPALDDDDSMLTRRFGKEVLNYYSGSPLNRFSFLRADGAFLRRAATATLARYVALSDLNPLTNDAGTQLTRFTLQDVKSLIGDQPFALGEDDAVKQWDSTKKVPLIVFLGMEEGKGDGSEKVESSEHGVVEGNPVFAVDVTAKEPFEEAAKAFLDAHVKSGGQLQTNPRAMSLEADDAAMFAQSRSIMDWNRRIPFCAGCGHPTLSVHAGYKRVCPPTDLRGSTSSSTQLPDCPSRKGVTNIAFPRTDPTMIAAIVSADGKRLLLGRQKVWPANMYSTLAGFLEPGESIEEAVRREAWEESGVKVGRVVVHSSQPWPYPASLMIGAIAQTLPGEGEKINLNDKELDTAKWFEFDEVREALEKSAGPLHLPPPEGYKEGSLRLPPQQAIANRLITAVANGFLSGVPKM